jgi:hypothetical protein
MKRNGIRIESWMVLHRPIETPSQSSDLELFVRTAEFSKAKTQTKLNRSWRANLR